MTNSEPQVCLSESPRLRVFWGEEPGKPDDRRPPDPDRGLSLERVRSEVYWAGRSRAARHSARIAA